MQSTIETWNFWRSTVEWARPENGTWHYNNFPKRSLRKGSRLTTIRPTGQHGLPIRFDEPNPGCFSWYLEPHSFPVQGQRGGCTGKKRGGVPAPHSLNSFVSCGLPLIFGFENDDPEKCEETIATPPKRGVPTDPDSGTQYRAPIPARRGSLSSVFIPAGRLGKDAPERGG